MANASLPIRESPEGYLETIPELVVEVMSKNDTRPAVERKVHDYHRAGVKVVWVTNPMSGTVTVYRSGQPPVTLKADDELTVDDIIPSFRLRVAEVFS